MEEKKREADKVLIVTPRNVRIYVINFLSNLILPKLKNTKEQNHLELKVQNYLSKESKLHT